MKISCIKIYKGFILNFENKSTHMYIYTHRKKVREYTQQMVTMVNSGGEESLVWRWGIRKTFYLLFNTLVLFKFILTSIY